MSEARLDRLRAERPINILPRLEPQGTARARFFRESGRTQPTDAWADLYARARAIDLPPAMVDLARHIARFDNNADARRDLVRLLMVVLIDVKMGSTRTPVIGAVGQRHLRERLEPLLGYQAAAAAPSRLAALIEQGATTLLATDDDPARPLVRRDDAVLIHRLDILERRVVRHLAARRQTDDLSTAVDVEPALADVQARPVHRNEQPSPLSEEQAAAVELAIRRRLSVISGGPGTGKTSIAVALIRTLVRLGVESGRILMAAPTGKAAHRLSESIRSGLDSLPTAVAADIDRRLGEQLPAAETLHRLLGYSPRLDRFARNADDPLAADVVIVDEASMIDLRLMDALLAGMSSTAQLVLLGDADQLPSVEAGAILRDLRSVDEGGSLSVQLTHSYRMDAADPKGAAILSAAQAVQAGRVAPGDVVTKPKKLQHAGFEQLRADDAETRRRFLDHWVARHLRARSLQRLARRILLHRDGAFRAEDLKTLRALTSALARFRLLAVTRTAALPTGADALNAAVHERLTEPSQTTAAAFFPGEPVMMLRNDYERGLFNGDIGVLMQVAIGTQAAAPMAVFPTSDGFEPFPLSVLQHDLTLAHAMTVHKAQGSEFDEVALFLPETDVPVLTREVLYTGLTRARTSVVLVGAPTLTARAITRPVVRYCGLAEGLAAAANATDAP